MKMADEEAEQERLSRNGGGCVAELQRLGERLQELERQLRESQVPAVEAATEYCQQLCQVRVPGGPLPLSPSQEKRTSERLVAERWSFLPWTRSSRCRGGSGEYGEGAFVCVRLWLLLSVAPGWGKGVVVWAENPPPLSFSQLGLCGPRSRGDVDGEDWSPLRRRERVGVEWRPGPHLPPPYCALGITAPPVCALLSPTPTSLRPLWFIPLPQLQLSSVPPPAGPWLSAGLCCSSFALGLKGPLLMFGGAVLADPCLLGERLG